jgi:hypothetical protein
LDGEGTNRAAKKLAAFALPPDADAEAPTVQHPHHRGKKGKRKARGERTARVVIKARRQQWRRCGGFGIHGGRAGEQAYKNVGRPRPRQGYHQAQHCSPWQGHRNKHP